LVSTLPNQLKRRNCLQPLVLREWGNVHRGRNTTLGLLVDPVQQQAEKILRLTHRETLSKVGKPAVVE
jgi:hypothetical protein